MATTKENKKTNTSKTKNKAVKKPATKTAPAAKKSTTKTVKAAPKTTAKQSKPATKAKTTTESKPATKAPSKSKKVASAPKNTKKPVATKTSTKKQTKKTVTPVKKTVRSTSKTPEVVKELHVEEEVITTVKENENVVLEPDYEIRSFLGANLPIERTKPAKKKRKTHYLKDAAFFATIVSVLDLFAMLFIKGYPQLFEAAPWINYTITVALDFVLVFIFTYALDYLIVEDAIQKNS